jgi:hypothetical protein
MKKILFVASLFFIGSKSYGQYVFHAHTNTNCDFTIQTNLFTGTLPAVGDYDNINTVTGTITTVDITVSGTTTPVFSFPIPMGYYHDLVSSSTIGFTPACNEGRPFTIRIDVEEAVEKQIMINIDPEG